MLDITSIDEAKRYISRNYNVNSDEKIVRAIDDFLRRRFSHTYSEYTFCENWVAYLSGFIWINLRHPVDPGEIMRYSIGGCSQQGLVFQTLLSDFGIDYKTVGFENPNHFAVGAKIDGVWYLFDSDLEPNNMELLPIDRITKGELLSKVYQNPLGERMEDAGRSGRIKAYNANTYGAWRGWLFQTSAHFLSAYGWLLCCIVAGILANIRHRAFQRNSVTDSLPVKP